MSDTFNAAAHDVGGFTVSAECVADTIDVVASDGRGIQGAESFTVQDSGIHNAAMLESYCKAILAQWAYNRKHKRKDGNPW